MTPRVNIILDLAAGGALVNIAAALQRELDGWDIRLVDYREPGPSCDVAHFMVWYLYREANSRFPAPGTLVSIHHLERPNETIDKLIADKVPMVAMSSEWHRYLLHRDASPSGVACIPYGVDCRFWDRTETNGVAKVPRPFTIGVVGQIYNGGRKGERLLPRILRRLPRASVRVIIIGQGWSDVVQLLRADGCEVEHYESLSREELREQFAQFDVFLCTSDVEGGPLPLLESMALGVTPVSTPVGLARDLLPGSGAGYLFPKGNAYLAARLLKKMLDGALPPADSGRLRALAESLSWSRAAKGYGRVYRAIAENQPLPGDPAGYLADLAATARRATPAERVALWANPAPTDRWSQPIAWRAWNKGVRKLTGSNGAG